MCTPHSSRRFISRAWFAEDAQQYGFISGGGGAWYSQTLNMLEPGDRVWVNIPQTGFVGVGIVEEPSTPAKDVSFLADGETKGLAELSLKGQYLYNSDDPEKAEYLVKVHWLKTVPVAHAVKETGFFGNQNTVCRPQADKWNFTVRRLKEIWHIED